MAWRSKKYKEAKEKFEKDVYLIEEAVPLLKEISYTKFDETMEMIFRLGVNPKHADQMVRGTVVLPHGTGKSKRVAVIASGEKMKDAEDAGADVVGGDDLIERISKGWMEFDAVVATPDMMKSVSKLGRTLGPRGLMPNPKLGTVTFEVAQAVQEIKAGKVEYRVDKTAIIHVPIGKISFSADQLIENARIMFDTIQKAKPPAAKGKYMKNVFLTSTMGPGVRIDFSPMEK
jgi:large subunit ribosomal protein L1